MALNPLLIKLFGLLSIFSVLKSCNSFEPGTWKNEKIEAGKREDFHALNNQMLEGLKANSPMLMAGVMSKELIEDNSRLRLIELCSNRLKEGTYSLLDEYYIVHKERGKKSIETNISGINNYTLNYNADTREMYMAFFIPKSIPNKYMISAIYCKYDYGWKLSHLELNPYTLNGKTAPELFDMAKEMYDKKYLLDALSSVELARVCANPYEGWKYPDETEMNSFYSKVINEINTKYRYPFTLKQVPTHPRIFSISTQTTPDGVFPLVYYMSSIKLKDTTALRKENEIIKKVIGKVIPGIDKDKKYVFYDAYNEWPRSDKSVDRYDMPDKLK
ncbi:MAG: hypothetical protein JWR54_1318 [Mucilaginibacter sp.]|nr:hypothetical protein [Mucilaginibacter sp.]